MFAAVRGLEDDVTDPGVEEGGIGTAVTTGATGGAIGAMIEERETVATPEITGTSDIVILDY